MIKLATEPQFNIVEIFQSLQGEGYNTGMDAIFIRFGKCNLACPWCDTDYLSYSTLSLSEILKQVEALSATNIIITGGEPSVVPEIDLLLKQLKQRGYFLTIETNGLQPVPSEIHHLSWNAIDRIADLVEYFKEDEQRTLDLKKIQKRNERLNENE